MAIDTTNPKALPKVIGERLVDSGRLAAGQLEQVLQLQAEKGGLLGPLLVQLGIVGERDLAETVSEVTGWPLAGKSDFLDPPGDSVTVSVDFLRQHHAVPLAAFRDNAAVALADPGDGFVLEALKLALGRPLTPRIGLISDIHAALARHFPTTPAAESLPAGDARRENSEAEEIAHLRDMASEAPVIRRVNELIARALELRASDIHIEPFEHEVSVRYRVDGALTHARSLRRLTSSGQNLAFM